MITIHNHLFTKVFALMRILSQPRAIARTAVFALLALVLGASPLGAAEVNLTPPTGTLYDPGDAIYHNTRGYTVSCATNTSISAIQWLINAPVGSVVSARIYNNSTGQLLVAGAQANGTGVKQYLSSQVNYTLLAGVQYRVTCYANNSAAVFPRKDNPSFPFIVSGITVSACWSSEGNTDVFPTLSNTWTPFMKLTLAGATTLPATAVTVSAGTLNGMANPSGLNTTAWFDWGTSPTLVGATSTTALAVGSGSADVAFNQALTGLAPDTTYYFRAKLNNANGTNSGSILSFTTGPEIGVEHPVGTNLVDAAGSVAFPDTATNQTTQKTFTITNSGGLALENLAITKSGTAAGEYSVTGLGATTLAAGASTTFTVTFAPSTTGARPAALLIASNDANENPFDIALTGNGTPPSAIIGGSDLLTGPDVTTLAGWLGEGSISLTKVFAAAQGDGKTAANFHTAVNGIGRTFTVIELPIQNGQTRKVIGAYNPQSWSSIGNYNYTSDAQRTAFLFNLTTGALQRQRLGDSVGQFQTYNGSNYGPTFGGGHDIYVDNSLRSGYANTYSYGSTGQNITGYGSSYNSLTFARMEVFTIGAAPVGTAPVVTTNAASGVGSATATLNGSVNPGSLATNASFHYSTSATLASGVVTTGNQAIGSGTSAVNVSQAISGLSAHTTYYFRAAGTNSAGTTNGSILNFTTGNTSPVAQNLIIAATTGDAQTSSGFFSSVDADGDSVSITAVNAVAGLTVDSFDASSVTYTPLSSFTGDASFNYTLSDGFGGTATGTVTVRVADNDAPVVAAHENIEVDPASPAGTVVRYTELGANDNVGVTGVMYSHASGSTFPIGTTTVNITATDAANNTGNGSFTVTVRRLAQTITFSGRECDKEDVLSTVLLNGVASSGLTVSYSIVSGPGSVSGNELTFSALGNVVVRASQSGDANYEPASTVDVTFRAVVNTAPVAVDDTVTMTTGDTTLYPLANDTDAEGNLLEIESVSNPAVTILGRSLIIPQGVTGTFTYTVTDCIATDVGTVTVIAGTPISGAIKWSGLLYDADGAIAGRMTAIRAASGRTTGRLTVGTTGVSIVFYLKEDEPCIYPNVLGTATISKNVDGRLDVSLVSGADTFTGSLRPSATSATAQKYNIALAGSDRTVVPGGGYLTASLRSNGLMSIIGRTPDGKSISSTAQLADNGSFEFYGFSFSTSPRAFLAGEGMFANLAATDLTAELVWLKPTQTTLTGVHRSGVDTVLVANGCAWTLGDALPDGAGTLTIGGGNFANDSTTANVVIAGNPSLSTLVPSWRVNLLKGSFTAIIKDPARPKSVRGSGVYLPKSNSAWGYFPGTTLGGRIELKQP